MWSITVEYWINGRPIQEMFHDGYAMIKSLEAHFLKNGIRVVAVEKGY